MEGRGGSGPASRSAGGRSRRRGSTAVAVRPARIPSLTSRSSPFRPPPGMGGGGLLGTRRTRRSANSPDRPPRSGESLIRAASQRALPSPHRLDQGSPVLAARGSPAPFHARSVEHLGVDPLVETDEERRSLAYGRRAQVPGRAQHRGQERGIIRRRFSEVEGDHFVSPRHDHPGCASGQTQRVLGPQLAPVGGDFFLEVDAPCRKEPLRAR